MTKVVNNTDELTFIITKYGLERIAEAIRDETVNIRLTKIKVGDANNEYYVPRAEQESLENEIPNGSFYIIDKELLEDGLTISLHAVFPESLDNCEIREVGIYETVSGEDKLFAISTQQPLVKPSTDLRHLISVDYYAFLKSENLANLYERIVLNPSNQLVTEEDLEDLMRTMLFTEGNLVDQIGSNSRVIGLNRARQLQEKIEDSQEKLSYMTLYNNFSTLLDFVEPEDIFGYWVFNYPRRTTPNASVVDIGKKGRNLSLNKPINAYPREYKGFMSILSFEPEDYFFLNQGVSTLVYNSSIFTIYGNVQVSSDGIAGNFKEANCVMTPDLSIKEGNDWEITFKMRTNEIVDEDEQPLKQALISSSFDGLNIRINDQRELEVNLVGIEGGIGTLKTPITEFTEYKIKLSYKNETYLLEMFLDGEWIEQDKMETDKRIPDALGALRLGSYQDYPYFLGTFDLKELLIKENGEIAVAGGDYIIENDISLLNVAKTEDISFTFIFTVDSKSQGDRTLLARSDYATNSHIFEVTERGDRSLEIILFSDSKNYVTFRTEEKVVPEGEHSLVLSYDKDTKNMSVYMEGRKVPMIRETVGDYTHMNASLSSLFSYTYTPTAVGYANSPDSPEKVLNPDGSPYTGEIWTIGGSNVFYNGNLSFYDQSKNLETSYLYAWNYNDGLDDHVIYTKTFVVRENTILYNDDYTKYEGTEFNIVPVGAEFEVQYNGNGTEQDKNKDKIEETLYAYVYTGALQTIWTNSTETPTILYTSNGDLYMGEDWYIEDRKVFYKDRGLASYTSKYDLTIPSLPLTSYVIGKQGLPTKTISSSVGIVSIIKALLSDDVLRAISLELEATMGKNPCVTTF